MTRFYILLLFGFLSFGCETKIKEVRDTKSNKREHVLQKQASPLKGKKINSLDNILGDSLRPLNRIIFLYNGFDCGTCVEIGYEIAKKLDSIRGKQIVYPISTSANIGLDQIKYNYTNYVYDDENDLIRKELKFIYTPVLLRLNRKNEIKDAFYPEYNRNIEKENKFIKDCIDHYGIEKYGKQSELLNKLANQ